MAIKIFNTLSKSEEDLVTITPDLLTLYVCGPTVYDRPHLGNARSAIIYDMFYRLFLQTFKQVKYVRNITDVDDKINKAAQERGIDIKTLTDEFIDYYNKDMNKLGLLRPSHEPRATEHIKEMIDIIQKLIDNGHAYESEGHVLFDVKSYNEYGKLSRRDVDQMIAGARVEVADFKRDPLDFVLWKPALEGDDKSSIFDSPWSQGRPGWHIECSAMSSKYLGTSFDIHGGGADLQFPHHENEIAQSRCAHKGSNYAKYWIHNGFLTVDGEKMSKSLKNFISVCDLLEKGEYGLVIRLALLSSHYRKPLDFNDKLLQDSSKAVAKFYNCFSIDDLQQYQEKRVRVAAMKSQFVSEIVKILSDDLNLPMAIAYLHQVAKKIDKNDQQQRIDFIELLDFVGLYDENFLATKNNDVKISEEEVRQLIEERILAKQNKDYAKADQVRDQLKNLGVTIEDKADGETIWRFE